MLKGTKKFLFLVFAMVLICVSIPVSTASAIDSEFDVTVTSNLSNATYGDCVTFTVAVENITVSGGLLSVDIPFRFDTAVFEFESYLAVFPSEWQNPMYFGYTSDKNGLLWLRMLDDSDNFTSDYGCTDDRTICFKVTLKVKDTSALGDTTITTNGNGGFEGISGTCADGQATIAYGTGGSSTINISNQSYEKGDVNGDGFVDNMDSALLLRYDAGVVELSNIQLRAADVNGDGSVDNIDAARILQYDAGILERL